MLDNGAKRKGYQASLASFAAITAAVKPIGLAIDYENNWSGLKNVAAFANNEAAQQTKQDIFALSEHTGIGANELTQLATSAAKTTAVKNTDGSLNPEKMKRFLSEAAQLSMAYGISAEEAGKRLLIYRSRMGLTEEQTRNMGDSISYLASKMNVTAADTSSVVTQMGAVAQMAGLSEKSIAGLSAAMVSTSENNGAASTAMKNFLLALSQGNAMSKEQKDAMRQLGFDNAGAIAEGLKKGGTEAERTLLAVLEAMGKMPGPEQTGAAKALFGADLLPAIAPLINDTQKLREIFALSNSEEANGFQLKTAEVHLTTTQGALDRLSASGEILAITIGSVLLPPLADMADLTASVIKPVCALVEAYPDLTQFVMLAGISLVGFKMSMAASGYAMTLLSDGVQFTKDIFAALRPSVIAATAAQKAQAAVALASAAKIRVITAAQWLWNAALTANPIGLIIVGIAALGAGLVWAYNKFEGFRAVVDTVWAGLKTVCPILELVEAAFTGTLTFISDLWNGMSLYDAGAKLIDTLVEGVKAMAMKPVETVKGIYKDIKGAFGFGDDEEPQSAKAAVEGAKAAYPGKDTASKQETGFWEGVGDFFTFGSNPEQAALQPAAAGKPFIGPTKPALSEAAAKPAQAKLPGQARTAPASSRIPEYAASGEARRTPPAGNTASPSAQQPVNLHFSMPVTLNGIPAGDMGDALLRSIDSRASAIEERIARMLGNIVGDQRRLAYGN